MYVIVVYVSVGRGGRSVVDWTPIPKLNKFLKKVKATKGSSAHAARKPTQDWQAWSVSELLCTTILLLTQGQAVTHWPLNE